jgi:lipopolysaccharide export system permease protein
MRILTRHILLELSKVLLLSLSAITGLVLIEEAARTALRQGLPPAQLLQLLPYLLPGALSIAVPVSLLLATTTVYARMSGANEVVGIKSLGIFPMAILWPALILGFLLSLVTVWLYDAAVSWGRRGVERVLVEAVEEIAYGMLRTQRQYSGPNFDIIVRDVDGRRLIRPTLWLKPRDRTPALTFMAEEARLESDREENLLKIILRNGTAEEEGGPKVYFPGVQEYSVPLWNAAEADKAASHPSWLPLHRIPRETIDQRAEIEHYEQELAARAAYQMLAGDFDDLTSNEWDTRWRHLRDQQSRLDRLETEPYRRWSAGFSCLCFVLVGAPMAIRLRNRDFLTSFFLCFAPILVVYYPALAYTVDAAKGGRIPPLAVWAGNAALAAWGGYLLRKVIRY